MATSHHNQQQYAQPNGHPPPPHYQHPQSSLSIVDQLNKAKEETYVQMGRAAEAMANNSAALDAYGSALRINQYNVDALRQTASILRSEDKYDTAVEYIRNILKIYPQDGEAFSQLGHCYLMLDELQQAYTAYQSALYNLRDPKEPKLWYGIGILYDRYGSLDHAEEAFTQVMRMAPDFDKANEIYFRLGIIYKQQAKYDQSLACFKYIVDSPPNPLNQTDIWFQIGHVYEQQKDYDSAKAAYLKVLERDAHHAKVLQQLGWLHHQQSTDYASQEQAIEYLEKSVSSDQNDAQSWYLLGRCYMSQHKFPKAYEAYQQAVYRDGRNPTFWCSIGVLYYQINQYRDALDAYSRAIRLNPNISEVWYDLGTLYESCNNQTNDALDAYNRAAELDPHNPQIKARVQLLRSGHSGGPASQHPHPQDVPPQAYQPTGASGPSQPQWGSNPAAHAPQHQQGPPPPLNASRDWGQRPADVHGAPPPPQHHQQQQPPPPPPQPMNPYEQRDGARPPPGQRQPSPRPEQTRHQDPYASRRPLSPSPRSRNSLPSVHRSNQSVSSNGPPAPQQQQHSHHHHQQQQQQQQQQPPPPAPRISNPNYGGQQLPPTSSAVQPPPSNQQHNLPPFSRGTPPPQGPTPDAGQTGFDRNRSPRSTYPQQQQQSQPGSYHPIHSHDPAGPSNIGSGAPAPSSAIAAAEAAAREREEKANTQAGGAKRLREWDDREGGHKKMASEEARAKLEDPSSRVVSPPSHPMVLERERMERDKAPSSEVSPTSKPAPAPVPAPAEEPTSTSAPQMTSPNETKRSEESQRVEEVTQINTVTHQSPSLGTIAPQASERAVEEQATQVGSATNEGVEMSVDRKVEETQAEPEAEVPAAPAPEPEPIAMEIDEESKPNAEPATEPTEPTVSAVEEPAARKMDVDENYDDDSADDTMSAVTTKEPNKESEAAIAPAASENNEDNQKPVDAADAADPAVATTESAVQQTEPVSVEANA